MKLILVGKSLHSDNCRLPQPYEYVIGKNESSIKMRAEKTKRTIFAAFTMLFLCILLFTRCTTSEAKSKYTNPAREAFLASTHEETDLIWFAQITDVHIGNEANNPVLLSRFLTNLNDHVHPSFVINTGDLVLGDYYEVQPILNEWILYDLTISSVIDSLSLDYYDLPGNHDNLDNNNLALFKQYSHLGKTLDAIHASWMINRGEQTALFVGISTADTIGGESQLSYEGRITESELEFLRTQLARSADIKIVFGHHSPVETEWGYTIRATPEKEDLMELLKASGASLYANGHRHKERIVKGDGTLFLTADNWPFFRLFVVDLKRGQISSFQYDANPISWPLILPVFPVDSSQVIQKQGKFSETPLEVLVFSQNAIETVSADAGNGEWLDFTRTGTFLWQLKENDYLQPQNNTLRIRASDQLGRRRVISLTIEKWEFENTQKSSIDIFAIIPLIALAVLLIRNSRKKQLK